VWGLDAGMLLDELLITNDRNFVPVPPALTVPGDQTIDELTTLTATNTAVAADSSATALTFSLTAAPNGVTLDPVPGVLTWTPTEEQGPSTNLIAVQVTDNGSLPLVEIKGFSVIVQEVNNGAPVLSAPGDQIIDEESALVLACSFSDPDLPTIPPSFSLLSAPDGMSINPATGVIVWVPTEAQGPSTNLVTVEVSDNGPSPLTDTNSFTVVVNEVNRAPVLTVPPDKAIHGPATLVVTNIATDPDLPANTLTFSLVSAPPGVSLDPITGVLTWTPAADQRPSTNLITVEVTDDGSPPLSDFGSFTVAVNDVNGAPILMTPPDQTVNELTTLTVTNRAIDPDVPADTLTFSLVSAPPGVMLDANTGLLTWTPTETDGPGTNLITVQVSDNGSPQLTDTKSFAVVVREVNRAPVLSVPANQTLDELTTLVVTNLATDPDVPTNTLTFSLASAPPGVMLDASTGVLTWTPTEAQGPSTNVIAVKVTDNGSPPLSDTETFTIFVQEANRPPVLTPPTDETIVELTTLQAKFTAADPDL